MLLCVLSVWGCGSRYVTEMREKYISVYTSVYTSLIRFASPSGKYALAGENSTLPCQIFYITCGWNTPSTSSLNEQDGSSLFEAEKFIASRPNG